MRNKGSIGSKKIISGITAFFLSLLILIAPGSFLRNSLGLFGTVITEFLFAAVSVLTVYLFGFNVKDALNIRKPRKGSLAPSLLIYSGAFALSVFISSLSEKLFGEEPGYSSSMESLLGGSNVILVLFAAALIPAVCEEILFRGAVQNGFSALPGMLLRIALNGVLFGFFHLSLYRLAAVSVLGAALSFAVEYSGSVFTSVALHFINNMIPAVLFFAVPSTSDTSQSAETVTTIVSLAAAVVLLSAGALIVIRRKKNRQ